MEKSRRQLSGSLQVALCLAGYVGAGSLLHHLFSMQPFDATAIVNVLFIALFVWYKSLGRLRTPIPHKISKTDIVLNCLLFTGLFAVGQSVGVAMRLQFGDPAFEMYTKNLEGVNPAEILLLMWVIAPVAEECLMRGFVLNTLAKSGHIVRAWFLQGLIFATLHGTLTHFFPTLLAGLFFGYVYLMSGSLKSTIGLHMLYNVCAVLTGPSFLAVGATYWYVYVILSVALIALMIWITRKLVQSEVIYGKVRGVDKVGDSKD